MRPVRLAVLGCGFWSQFQIAAWQEVGGVELVALYNRTRSKAEALAARFGVPAVYDDAETLFRREQVELVDIVTNVGTHASFVALAASRGVPVISQKPMAPDLETAEAMVRTCREAGVWFAIHENWRWQRPLREVKGLLDGGQLGRPFRGRITFSNSFPVFENQPFLAELEQFLLADIGSHVLDSARFLFGEARRLYCHTRRVNAAIRGEDVATVMLQMASGATVVCEMSYASRLEHGRFPETYVVVECERGSVELGPDYWVRVTTESGTVACRYPPARYAWADRAYDLVQASIVPCNAHLLASAREGVPAETSGDDNLNTVRLVSACYESARAGEVVSLDV